MTCPRQDIMRFTACALHTIELKHLHIPTVLCGNVGNITFILLKTVIQNAANNLNNTIINCENCGNTNILSSNLVWLKGFMLA